MKPLRDQRGIVMTSALLLMIGFLAMSLALIGFAFSHFSTARRSLIALNALEVAEAGADDAMYNINRDPNYQGTHPPSGGACNIDGSSGQVQFYSDSVKGLGKYETCIENTAITGEKIVYAAGRVWLPSTAAQPITRKIKLLIKGSVPFNYGVQSDTGPIYLFGNTGFVADVHTNAFIRVQDNAVSIEGGTFTVAGTDTSGDAGFPATCSITGNGKIVAGTITAAGEVTPSPPNCKIDTTGSTVTENAVVSPQPLPTVDRDAVDAGITDGNRPCGDLRNPTGSEPYTIYKSHYNSATRSTDGSCSYPTNPTELKKNKQYVITGNAHIRGDLVLDGNVITIANSVTSPPYILVDGTITIKGNGVTVAANTSGIGAVFVAYSSKLAHNNDSPPDECGDKNANNNNGNNLQTAIDIQGNSLSLFANFLAPNGSITYKARGSVGKMAARCIAMNGSGLTTFIDITGGSTGTDVWDVRHYQQIFD